MVIKAAGPELEIYKPEPDNFVNRNGKNAVFFRSVAVIGAAGQTGELFTKTLGEIVPVEAVVRHHRWGDEADHPKIRFHSSIETMLVTSEPEAVIVATPNPTEEVLKEIAQHVSMPITLILPQNGVDVVPAAETILADVKDRVRLVRASLSTNVWRNEQGKVVHSRGKRRIALASVDKDRKSLTQTEQLFTKAGFDVKVVDDYKSMEWTKLMTNLFGSTSIVTGFFPREALRDKKIFRQEMRALKDRLEVLKQANIELADLWGIGKLRWLARLPISVTALFRGYIAEQFAQERSNQLPAAARVIQEDAELDRKYRREIEALDYYFRPIIDLAATHDLTSPVDQAIRMVLKAHQNRIFFNLAKMGGAAREELLLKAIEGEVTEPYTSGSRFQSMIAEGLMRWGMRRFTITGVENLAEMGRYLSNGQSVEIAPNHTSHPDHPTVKMALKRELGKIIHDETVVFVAGMLYGQDSVSKIFNRTYPKALVATSRRGAKEQDSFLARAVNKRAEPIIQRILNEPRVLVVYPEGTRSKELRKPIEAVAAYFGHENLGGVFPVAITGTWDLLHTIRDKKGIRGKIAGLVNFLRLAVPLRATVNVHFGEPIHPKFGDRAAVEDIMRSIAARIPEEDRGEYKGIV